MEPLRVVRRPGAADLAEACRLRYEVYVEEMRRPQAHADHGARTVAEPMDEWGEVFVARDPERVVGTIRCNRVDRGDPGIYWDLYRLQEFQHLSRARMALVTKLVVAREHRSGPVALMLQTAVLERALEDGVEFGFMDCNHYLVAPMARLGWRTYGPPAHHPEYGDVMPMCLPLLDVDSFRQLGSPLLPVVVRHLEALQGGVSGR